MAYLTPVFDELVSAPVPLRNVISDSVFATLSDTVNLPLESGGYDYDFVEEVSGELKCETICTKVLRDPHVTDCCGQHFCDTCLQHWFKRKGKKECPHCREENFTHILYKPAKRKIDQLKVYCINHKAGCEWVGGLSTVQAHLGSGSGCGYVEVCCTNACGKKLIRKDLVTHIAQQCPQRMYKCQHCGKEDTYQTITKTHYNECANYPLDCPNKCGTREIKRAEMGLHQKKCPREPVECPFKEAGCQVKVVRNDFDNHMTTSQQQHLLALMGAFREAKADLREAKADLEAIRVEKEVIAIDVKILRQSSQKESSDLVLASIESQLEMKSFRLMPNGPPLTIRMTNFSHYQQNGKVWHSPSFYYGDGYKMQLAVYANGTGAGAGTHVSIVLLRMKGEYDDQLKWTDDIYEYDMRIKIATQKPTPKQKSAKARPEFSHSIPPPNRIIGAENVREEGKKEKFVDLQTMNQSILLNDSIVLQATLHRSIQELEVVMTIPDPFFDTVQDFPSKPIAILPEPDVFTPDRLLTPGHLYDPFQSSTLISEPIRPKPIMIHQPEPIDGPEPQLIESQPEQIDNFAMVSSLGRASSTMTPSRYGRTKTRAASVTPLRQTYPSRTGTRRGRTDQPLN